MLAMYVNSEDFEDPGERAYFLLAGNGVFLVKNFELYSCSIEIDTKMPRLIDHVEGVTLKFGKIPRTLMSTIWGFFKAAHVWHHGEAIVFLYYSTQKRSFCAKVPPQRVYHRFDGYACHSGYHVQYDTCARPPDYVKLGTIHSHGIMPAYHSNIDDRDEMYEDGLHITVGDILARQPDISISFVVNGRRFKFKPEDVLDGYGELFAVDPPPLWMQQLTCVVEGPGMVIEKKLTYEPQEANCDSGRN